MCSIQLVRLKNMTMTSLSSCKEGFTFGDCEVCHGVIWTLNAE